MLLTQSLGRGDTKGTIPNMSLLSFSCSAGNGWWWVPVVAPLVGATLGTATYQLLVALHHPEDSEQVQKKASDLETLASVQMPESKL